MKHILAKSVNISNILASEKHGIFFSLTAQCSRREKQKERAGEKAGPGKRHFKNGGKIYNVELEF